jgi:hypothetical protein
MTGPRSSRIALTLLDRLLAGAERESLIGDIAEQAARGRSATWVWTQTILAIAQDALREVRAHPLACLLGAFFLGYGAAAILGTVKLLPGLRVLDQVVVGLGAGWVVGRAGGLPAVATFAAMVLSMRSPIVEAPVMGFLDHFRGAWLLVAYGMASLPYSAAIASACIGTGGLCAACRRPVRTTS